MSDWLYQFTILFEMLDGRMKMTHICSPLPSVYRISHTNRTSGRVYCVKGFCHVVIWTGSLYFILPIQWQLNGKQLYNWHLQMHTNSVLDISDKRQIISINIIAVGMNIILQANMMMSMLNVRAQFPNMRWVFIFIVYSFCGLNGWRGLQVNWIMKIICIAHTYCSLAKKKWWTWINQRSRVHSTKHRAQ